MIDLHSHSTASDGRSTPRALMHEAAAAGLSVVGLTDHDTTAGWAEAEAWVSSTGVSLVRGVEISAKLDGVSVHLLGYLLNPDHPRLLAHCARLIEEREGRAREMVTRIGVDVRLSWIDVAAQAAPGIPIGRPHIADALIANGVVGDRDEAFHRFLHPSTPYYVPHYAPSGFDVVEWVREAGGKLVFAHPNAPKRGRTVTPATIEEMADAGMFGLEIDHRDNVDTQMLIEIAERRGLVRTGASDYHGSGKPNRLGDNTTSPDVLAAIAHGAYLEVLHP